ncbi:MAG: ribbon-helix-helix domain-containing protein [Pseudomonadota bacterium]|nr:ribbon-helix-helix domain-containing protein [Pseudomonadota bacterium]MEC7830412.1 ribbon-helix-helix domain-containing protein [Pseudomonadota bacterium]MEC9414315.1 ribbon-helix-helix domain-containing protein [Pseudomonadota bacterium]|tara:strand:+ start:513 stop:731 length:219 start_codon:yes stop_codon:yes gene_type:complete
MVNQIKKTVRLNGHITSIALEKEFWKELQKIAVKQSKTIDQLIEEIDTNERLGSLASAVRVFVLKRSKNESI